MPSPLQLVAAWSFGLQGAFAVPAIIQQTEHYYDLAGSIGFLSTVRQPSSLRAWICPSRECLLTPRSSALTPRSSIFAAVIR